MAASWLDDFLEYSAGGESPPKFMFWVGVSTIAAVLQRKVWIDQISFQWTPNFYILLVGPPGGPKKTTSIQVGRKLLKRVEGINLGPQIVTWQQLVTHMAEARRKFGPEGNHFQVDGEDFEASCVTIHISEFGMFFDPLNRELIDNLTDMWDGKLDTIRKETRTMGSDEIVNPWLNIIAATTPAWIADNFSAKLVGSGFASRPVFLYEEAPLIDIAYPSRQPQDKAKKGMADKLVKGLYDFSGYAGEFVMTDEAMDWGEAWYHEHKERQRSLGSHTERGFYERMQGHLHKLAMVLCVSRGGFPHITLDDMKMAAEKIKEIEPDVRTIFSAVGKSRISTAAGTILEVVSKGEIQASVLFFRHFFRTMSSEEFDIALKSVQKTGLITLTGNLSDPMLRMKEQ